MIKLLILPILILLTGTFIPGTTIIAENKHVPRSITIIEAEITGYSSTESQTDNTPFLTASQTPVRDGVIACPRYIKFGTIVEIDGKEYICEDRMNIRYTDRFDIWFNSTIEALEYGIKDKLIKIYE